MGPRNLLILFFSTVAVSLVILIIFFSLFFKNVDLSFNTRLPESAPDLGKMYGGETQMDPNSKASGLMRSTVNVPPESREPAVQPETEPADSDLPPISDDHLLEKEPPELPVAEESVEKPGQKNTAPVPGASPVRSVEKRPVERPRPVERTLEPVIQPQPAEEQSGPPVPGQSQ